MNRKPTISERRIGLTAKWATIAAIISCDAYGLYLAAVTPDSMIDSMLWRQIIPFIMGWATIVVSLGVIGALFVLLVLFGITWLSWAASDGKCPHPFQEWDRNPPGRVEP